MDKGYYKLTDGKAGITLNVEKALELPVGAEVEIEGVLGANLFCKEDVAMVYPTISVNSWRVLDEDHRGGCKVWSACGVFAKRWRV